MVPTVALAINHEEASIAECELEAPLAYRGGELGENSIIIDKIKEGSKTKSDENTVSYKVNNVYFKQEYSSNTSV